MLLQLVFGAALCAQAPVSITVNGSIGGSGSMTLWVDSYSKTIRYGQFSSAASLAADFGGHISADTSAPVWAKGFADGTVQMRTRYGSVSNLHIDITPDGAGQGGTGSPPIAVAVNPGGVGGGTLPTGTLLYSYSITGQGGASGFDPAGNIVAYSDSVNAQWVASYDSLNRLTGATQSSTINQIPTPWGNAMQQFLCWQYDSFGNRLQQASSSSAFASASNCAPAGGAAASATTTNVNANNQLSGQNYSWDASGNLTGDGLYTYQYDGAGRLCAALKNVTGQTTGYLYNADGRRVAKGTITPQTGNWCDLATNGFVLTSRYVLNLGGETLTEFSNGTSHSDIPLGDGVGATLTADANTQTATHFQFTDWLGTRRVQTDALGSPEEVCSGGAFGDGMNCTGQGATDRHFTGKERDGETASAPGRNDGLDYFGARYYASNLGRWMSPDWAEKPEAVPYSDLGSPQSLTLYGYVKNNPLAGKDADGHDCCDAIKDLIAGATNAYISDNLGGFGRIEQHTLSGRLGNVAGDFAAAYQGINEIGAGAAGEGGGLALDLTGVGTLAGVPLQVASAGVIAHGTVTTGVALGNLLMSATGPYVRPSNATTKTQRESAQGKPCATCGATGQKNNADHIDPLVEQHYKGGIDTKKMRSPEATRPQCQNCSNRQGGYLSGFSKAMKSLFGFGGGGGS